jgi:hypothetical protein
VTGISVGAPESKAVTGISVGASEGEAVTGISVGASEGEAVTGISEGKAVTGISVGASEGEAVTGISVGALEGEAVACDGLVDGICEPRGPGLPPERVVGIPEGSVLGSNDSRSITVGNWLGSSDGSKVCTHVGQAEGSVLLGKKARGEERIQAYKAACANDYNPTYDSPWFGRWITRGIG